MSYLELFLIAAGLCFDTFAVSVSGGVTLCKEKICVTTIFKIILTFAFFQSAFLLSGWLLGNTFSSIIQEWDHWIAFALLVFIGVKMLIDSFSVKKDKESKCVNLLKTHDLIVLSIATSIDAIAVGVSFACVNIYGNKITFATFSTFAITVFASFLGLRFGTFVGRKFEKYAGAIGGIILILIGIKILIEHI